MPRRRDTILILVVAIVIALLAWALLTSGKSNAPEVGSVAPPVTTPSIAVWRPHGDVVGLLLIDDSSAVAGTLA